MTKFAKKVAAQKERAKEDINKAEKARHYQLEPYKWKPGVSPNPAGRPKGIRNRLSEAFLKDILYDWAAAGTSAIQQCRLEDPSTYLRVVASLVPKEFSIKEGDSTLEAFLEQFSGQQIDELITGLVALGATQKVAGAEVKALPRSKPNGVH